MSSQVHAGSPITAADAAPQGSECAADFDGLYQEHFDFVWRSLRRLGVPDHLLDDAVQETFLVVYRRLPDVTIRVSVRAWLSGIVMRVASEVRRSMRRKDPQTRAGAAGPDVDTIVDTTRPDPHRQLEQADAVRLLHDLLAELDGPKREVFVLVELEQLTIPEVAEALGVNENTVYSRIRAARKAFDQAVARCLAREKWRDRCPA
jgi:RNA polymerase sigma-70 factor (ECF subfamily)